jgi:dihydroorotase-like cyclic amidohydrolase
LSSQSSQNRLLIKGGRVVNDDHIFDADVYIEEGIIRYSIDLIFNIHFNKF